MRRVAIFFTGVLLIGILTPLAASETVKRERILKREESKIRSDTYYRITRIIDAQTFILNDDKDLKVRLVGVDVPERYKTKKLYRQAKRYGLSIDTIQQQGEATVQFIERLCKDREVTLNIDSAWSGGWHRDRSGRLMVHLFVYCDDDESDEFLRSVAYSGENPPEKGEDGRLKLWLNAELIKEGYARVDRTKQSAHFGLFENLEKRAQRLVLGYWKDANSRE